MTPAEMIDKIFDLVEEGYAAAKSGDMSLATILSAEARTIVDDIENNHDPKSTEFDGYLDVELDVSVLQCKLEGTWPGYTKHI